MQAESENWRDGLMVELTAQVVAAYVSKNVVLAAEMGSLINSVHKALSATMASSEPVVVEKQTPAVPIKKSVQSDRIICLECGLGFKSIRRHLGAYHGMSPREYREKWQLSANYPTVAPAYAEARSRLAKQMGLGQKTEPNKTTRRRARARK